MAVRRGSLSVDGIVAAAVEIADAEGIDAVTMRRLADALHVHPTSIYTHLDSKEVILEAMAEALFTTMSLPDAVDDWRVWLRTLAAELRELARSHPGAFMVLTRAPATGPVARRKAAAAFAAFRAAGFPPATALQALAGCSLALLGLALNECPPTDTWAGADAVIAELDAYPDLADAARAAEDRTDDVWELLVGSLIDGLEQRTTAGRPRRSRRRSARS